MSLKIVSDNFVISNEFRTEVYAALNCYFLTVYVCFATCVKPIPLSQRLLDSSPWHFYLKIIWTTKEKKLANA